MNNFRSLSLLILILCLAFPYAPASAQSASAQSTIAQSTTSGAGSTTSQPADPTSPTGAAPPPTNKMTPPTKVSKSGATPSSQDIASAKASGKVWVNTESGVYQKGGRWYGKTKTGKFMTESEAKAAGFKAANKE
jgi:hypothetical protein